MYRLKSLLRSRWQRYAFSVLATATVGLLYLAHGFSSVDSDLKYFGFTLAVLASALLGGLGPGLLTTGLSAFTSAYFLLPPVFSIRVNSAEMAARLVLFFGEGVLLSCMGHMVRNRRDGDKSGPMRYVSAAVFVGAATGFKLTAFSDLERELPFTFFYTATAVSALMGGIGPGLVATVLSSISARYFFFEPLHSFSVSSPINAIRILLFIGEGIFFSWLSARHQEARHLLSQALTRMRLYGQQLWQSVEETRALRHISRDVIWEWDLSTNQVMGGAARPDNPAAAGATLPFSSWLEQIHPDDRSTFIANLSSALERGRDECFCQYRRLRDNKGFAHVSDHAYIIRNDSWNPVRVIGRSTDITEERNFTQPIASEGPYQAVFEHSPLAILLADDALHVVAANDAACEVFGYDRARLMKLQVEELFKTERRGSLRETMLGLDRQGKSPIRIEETCVKASGEGFPARITAARIAKTWGSLADRMIVIEEISEDRR